MLVVIGMVLLCCICIYCTCILPTQWLDVQHAYPGLDLGLRVLQVSDLHVEMLRVSAKRLVSVAEQNRIDYIWLTGDFLTSAKRIPKVERYVRALSKTGLPMFAVLGNHDYRTRRHGALIELLERHGVTVLRNKAVSLGADVLCEDVWLVGIDDLSTRHSHVAQAFANVPQGARVVVMTHDPNVVLQIAPHRFDYLVAGHLHGKQFRIPGLFRFKPMGPLPKQGIYRGEHLLPQGLIYISKGVGQVGVNLRFLVRSEVTVHHL